MVAAAGSKSGFIVVDGNGRLPVADGETLRIRPAAGRIRIARVGKGGKVVPVEDVVAIASPKDGGDLVLLLDGHTRVVLDDFMKLCRKGSCDIELPDGKGGVVIIDGTSHAIATGGDGSLLLHMAGDQATLSGLTDSFARYYDVLSQQPHATPDAAPGAGAAPSAFGTINPLVAIAGLAAAGGVALAAGSGGGGSDHNATPEPTPTPTPTPQPTADSVIHISAAAGPISAALSYQVIGADGTILATGTTDTAGMADVRISADYKGAILVRILDANGAAADYTDEASGNALSLSTDMRAFAVKADGDLSVSVTPLTELIARKLLESHVGATLPDAAAITQGTEAISQAFGVDMSQGVVTVLDPAFNEADGISAAEAYGIFLAKLSGLDRKTGGIDATLDALASGITLQGSVAMLSSDSKMLLQQGAAIFESGSNRDKAVIIPQDEPLAELSSDPLLLLTVGQQNITELLHAGVFNLDTKAAVGSQFQVRMTLPENTTEGATITVKAGDTVVGEWAIGLMDVVNGYADILLGTDFLANPIEGRITMTAEITGMANARTASASLTVDTLAPPAPGMTLAGGTVSISDLDSGSTWSYSVDGGDTWTNGQGTSFTLAPGSYSTGTIRARQTDQNGNAGAAQSLAAAEIADAPPSVTITSDRASLIDGQTTLLTFTFSTAPTGFTQSDIVVQHATIGSFTQTSDPKVYTAVLTPQPAYQGSTTVAILADSWQGGSGSNGTAAQSQPIAIDIWTPASTPAAPIITLVEDTGVDATDNVTSNGQVHIETSETAGQIQYSLDGGLNWLDATSSTITLPAGIYQDNAVRARVVIGSTIGAETLMPALTVDTAMPSVTITSDKHSLLAGESATLTLAFDEFIIDMTADRLEATGGTLSNLMMSPYLNTYTVVYTPTADTLLTADIVRLSGYHDLAGNLGGTATQSLTFDAHRPSIISAQFTGKSDQTHAVLNADDSVTITVTFDEDIIIDTTLGSPYLTLFMGSGTRSAPYMSRLDDRTLTFQYVIQAGDNDALGMGLDGYGGFSAFGAVIRDAAGNRVIGDFQSTAHDSAYRVDTTAPTLVDTSPGRGGTIGRNSQLVFHFSEDVTFGAGSITISNGASDIRNISVTDPQVAFSGSTVVVTLSTPLNESAVYGVTISQNAILDLAGNSYAGLPQSSLEFNVRASGVAINDMATQSYGYSLTADPALAETQFGAAVSSIGDFDGDGIDDYIIGAPSTGAQNLGGSAVIVLGRMSRDSTAINAAEGTVIINGAPDGQNFGYSVAAAGDVNGDGSNDIIIGSPGLNSSFILDGANLTGIVNLGQASDKIVLSGAATNMEFGSAVSALGDVNGDGLADAAIASREGVYILFGRTGTDPIDVASIRDGSNADGFFLNAGSISSPHGPSVSSAGDLNGDGRSDILVGFGDADNGNGRTYVVFGRTSHAITALDTITVGMSAFLIEGGSGDASGTSVAAAGDVNNDGYDDLLVGAPGKGSQGGVYVLFGSSDGPFAPATLVEYEGNSGDDAFNSDGVGTTIMGRGGNDQIYLTGPNMVGYGGPGDDTFVVHPSYLGSLASTDPVEARSSRIDGGSGIDTLMIAPYSGNTTIDLRELAKGSATVDGDGRMESIEIVDLLVGQVANTLWVTEESVIAMSRANVFLDDGRVQLMVKGDSQDVLDVQFLQDRPGFETVGAMNYNSETFSIVRTDAIDIFVQQGINITVL